jgi:hypothetical protein
MIPTEELELSSAKWTTLDKIPRLRTIARSLCHESNATLLLEKGVSGNQTCSAGIPGLSPRHQSDRPGVAGSPQSMLDKVESRSTAVLVQGYPEASRHVVTLGNKLVCRRRRPGGRVWWIDPLNLGTGTCKRVCAGMCVVDLYVQDCACSSNSLMLMQDLTKIFGHSLSVFQPNFG